MPAQSIDLPGIGNARELGGYAAAGRHIKKGTLIRCASLNNATEEALARLSETYRVETVVDLRMSNEAQGQPDPAIEGAKGVLLPVVEIADFLSNGGVTGSDVALLENYQQNRMQIFELAYSLGMLSESLYTDFLLGDVGIKAYARFFEELLALDEGRAILWHCTDGKDRTGCAAMLVLFALGADRETVLADYLLTNTYNAAALEAVRQQTADLDMDDDKRAALLFMSGGVIKGYMDHAIDTLEERYGSVGGYLSAELSVGPAQIERLRDMFLV